MTSIRNLLLLTVALFIATLASAGQMVIRNITVIDGTGAAPKPGMTVVLDNGIILEISKSESTQLPAGGQVVDGSGKFLIPGLWDMHLHAALIGNEEWTREIVTPLLLANGIVGFRDMGGDLKVVREIASNAGMSVVAAGPMLDGPGDPFPQIVHVESVAGAREAVDSVSKQKADFVKMLSSVPRDAYFAVAEESKKLGMVFVGHVPQNITAAEASDAGQKSIEHLDGILLNCSSQEEALRKEIAEALAKENFAAFAGIRSRMLDTYDPAKAALLFARFKKNGTWQVPTFSFLRTQTLLPEANKLAESYLKYVPKALLAQWNSAAEKRKPSPEDTALGQRRFGKTLELVNAMNKAGVGILAGTDADGETPFIVPGFGLHDELATLVRAGLSPMEALQSVTLSPARYLGRDKNAGTIEKGKAADVVLLDANPVDDINNTRKIHAVVVGGKLLSRADLDALLASAVSK